MVVSVHEETSEDIWVKCCRLDEPLIGPEASGYGLVGGLRHDEVCRGRLDMLSGFQYADGF